jgi:hypothetical protein
MHTILLHASALPTFWLHALATTTYLLNRRPCLMLHHTTPYELLFGHALEYDHLHVFGSLYCPSAMSTLPHKLALHIASSMGAHPRPRVISATIWQLDM